MLLFSFELVSLARVFNCQKMERVYSGLIAHTVIICRHYSGQDNLFLKECMLQSVECRLKYKNSEEFVDKAEERGIR